MVRRQVGSPPFGQEIDLTKPIFGQLNELLQKVPVMALLNDQNENCPYVNMTGWARNCHLCYGADYSEDCYFSESLYYSKSSADCLHGQHLERCYECLDCNDGYSLRFSQNCNNCSDSAFLFDCIGCSSCFGCVGLRQKKHCFFNEQLKPEEYAKRVQQYDQLTVSGIEELRRSVTALKLKCPTKAFIGTQNEDVSGDYLFRSQRSEWCFDSDGLQDCKHCSNVREAKDCQDLNYWGHPGELCYECMGVGEGAMRILFTSGAWAGTENMIYCSYCIACRDCFACSGLRRKQYCILNKQYSKEEYEQLVPKIIEHMKATPLRSLDGSFSGQEWSEFQPIDTSFFAYNETLAQLFFPLTKDEVLKRGWRWREVTDDIRQVERTIAAQDLPATIADVPDDVLQWAIQCERTKRPFKVIRQELDFYRSMGLPLPRIHPDERHRLRWTLRACSRSTN